MFALATVIMPSCEKDGDIITTSGLEDTEVVLEGDIQDIVLSTDNLTALALTLYWNENGKLSSSDPLVALPDYAISNTIQMAPDESFSTTVDFLMDNGVYSEQFTAEALNNAVGRIGFTPGTASLLYIRIKSTLGNNIEPSYSNVLVVSVTPYAIDMSLAVYLSSALEDTGHRLYSPASDGIYSGFIGAGSWENWWLLEANGVKWGNVGDDGGGVPFVTSSNDQAWNYWYPGVSGCYYTIVNTTAREWSALLIPSLTVSGDIEGEMTYNRKENIWTLTFNNATAGDKSITISGTGKQYNVSTSTDDAAAIDTPVAFAGSADALTFGNTASAITVNVPVTGEVTLTLNLEDPKNWTLTTGEGGVEEEEPADPYLYFSGIDDGISGSWTFDNYLCLYNEDNKNYGGACNVNSLWGYQLYTIADDWSSNLTMVEGGNAYEGKLQAGEGSNITAPEPGLYLFDVSLSGMTYKVMPITTVSYAGLNDDWAMREMTATETPGVYTADVVKSANTPWGVKIYINESWDYYFGGGSGALKLYQDGFDGDNELENGNYVLTVDLCKGTYSYTVK